MNGLKLLSGILPAILGTIDKAVLDPNEANRLRAEIIAAIVDQNGEAMQAAASIVGAEAQGESWLQRNWRPIAMLNFLGLLNLYWFGLAPEYLVRSPELVDKLFTLLSIGLGGYIAGRTGEKIVERMRR